MVTTGKITDMNKLKLQSRIRVEARRGKARQGEARRGEARRGEARRGKARQGKASIYKNTAQNSQQDSEVFTWKFKFIHFI